MSAALLWEIVRNNSAFLLKQRGAGCTFSREPCNLKNRNTFRSNGLVHKKVVGVEPIKDKKGVAIVTRRRGAERKPAKRYARTEMKRDSRRTMKAIQSLTSKGGYRRDLKAAALRRASAILRSQKTALKKTSKAKAGSS